MSERMRVESNDVFDVTRFSQHSRVERERAWLDHRSQGVGGSDMSTILGLNKYKTPYALWLEKTGRTTPDDISDRWAIRKGDVMEGELRRWFRSRHPELRLTDGTGVSLTSRAHPFMLASLDGFLWDPQTRSHGVLECKTANMFRAQDWRGDDGEPVIPAYYRAQVTHYLAVTGWSWGWMVADVSGPEPLMIRFTRDEDDVDAVVGAAESFWGFVKRDEPPELTGADVDELYPQDDGDVIRVESGNGHESFDNLAAVYRQASDEIRALKSVQADIAGKLKTLVSDHKGVQSDAWKATYATTHYKESFRKAFDARVLRVSRVKERKSNG